jgi:hypothetical protein
MTRASFGGLEADVPVTPPGCAFTASFQHELPLVDPEAG